MSLAPALHDPVWLALKNREYPEVLKAMVVFSDADLSKRAEQVTDEQIPELATYIVTKCSMVGVQQVMTFGGMLELFALLTESRGHSELMRSMEDDLGVSRSQAYRCRAVWRCFGRTLLSESETLQQFCRESLKLLAEERTPDGARNEALERARQGERITIKVAEHLRTKHGMTVPGPVVGTTPAVVSNRPGHWMFSGSVVRIKLVHNEPGELADVPAVIRDLEAAINELRQLQANMTAA